MMCIDLQMQEELIMEKVPCPDCEKVFEVHRYGYSIKCPNCYTMLDIFPDDAILINSEMFGQIAIAGVKNNWLQTLKELALKNFLARS